VKYSNTLTTKILGLYTDGGLSVPQIAKQISEEIGETVPERSIIAKLSTLGVYKKKQYLTKRGEVPIRKSAYIEKIAQILECDVETLESLEKVNKNVLILLASLEKPQMETDPSVLQYDANALAIMAEQAGQARRSAQM